MKCSDCKHVEIVDDDAPAGACKLNPPQTIVIPQHNRMTGETSMALQATNPLVVQGNYDNGGCSHYAEAEVEVRLELS